MCRLKLNTLFRLHRIELNSKGDEKELNGFCCLAIRKRKRAENEKETKLNTFISSRVGKLNGFNRFDALKRKKGGKDRKERQEREGNKEVN